MQGTVYRREGGRGANLVGDTGEEADAVALLPGVGHVPGPHAIRLEPADSFSRGVVARQHSNARAPLLAELESRRIPRQHLLRQRPLRLSSPPMPFFSLPWSIITEVRFFSA